MSDEMGSSSAATAEPLRGTSLHVLGPLVVVRDGRELHVAGTQRRRLLAFLASRAGRSTSVDAIVDVLWPDDPPPSAAKTVQSHVVRLRRSLAPLGEPIATVAGGYRLDIDPAAVDAVRFEMLLDAGRAELADGRPTRARAVLSDALTQWRGTPYIDADGAAFADAERVRLEELRLAATEDLAEAELLAGAAAAAVPELERLVTAEPGRERAWSLLMRCLYALGRQHDALVAFQRARRVLAESFGLEPGPALRAVERQVLEQDPALALVPQGGRLPAPLRSDMAFVGRQTELAWLRDAWSVARTGNGQVRVLGGPPGSGRTELTAALARLVASAGGGTVEYVRLADGLDVLAADGSGPLAGRVVDAVTDRCRQAPMLLVLDDVDATTTSSLPVVEALADAAARLSLLLVLVADRSVGGPAAATVRRIEQTIASSIELGPMDEAELRTILHGDGTDDDTAALAIAVADGLPGVARREAAAWMERAASDRLTAAAASSVAAVSTAGEAHDSVFDEVLALVAARARRDSLAATTWAGRKPYRALAPYGPEDADLFVGRERLVAELAARVLDRRLVAVVGASGSGKSSIVRAGLDPLVRSGRLPGGVPWRSHVIVPGTDPIGTLLGIEQIDEPGPQLIIVDQFEEIAASGGADAFAARVLDLVLDAALDVHVVLVVRADQYGTLARSRHLVEMVDDAHVLVGPPTEDELRRIATQPARRTGCTVEPELVELLVADVAGQDGTLPLASAALAEVWERRRDDVLTAEQYVEIGGLAAAVERLGERALDDAPHDAVRDLLLRLVDVTDDGQWVRRRIATADVPPELAAAADALVAARLIVRDSDVLDIVHEIVFRAWPRLASWLEDARADLVIDRDLRIAARVWAEHGRSDDDVYRGSRLHTAIEWLGRHPDAGAEITEFVGASSRLAEHEHQAVLDRLAAEVRSRRRLSRALVAAAVLLVVSLVGAVLAVVGRQNAEDARQASEASEARAEENQRAAEQERDLAQTSRLITESERMLDTRLDLAMLLAVENRRRIESPETNTAVFNALTRNLPDDHPAEPASTSSGSPPYSFLGFLPGPALSRDVDLSADGRIVAAGGSSAPEIGLALVFDTTSRREIGRIRDDTAIGSVDVSDDGRFVLAASADAVHVFDVEQASSTTTRIALSSPDTVVLSAFFDPSGNSYFVTTSDNRITGWDRANGTPLDVPLPSSPLNIAGIAPDGTLAVAQPDASNLSFVFWDLVAGQAVRTLSLENLQSIPATLDISPDIDAVAGASSDGQVVIWDLATGALRPAPAERPQLATALVFNPADPTILAVGTRDGAISFYDVAAEHPTTAPLPAGGSAVTELLFSADGRLLMTATANGLAAIWAVEDSSTSFRRVVDCCATVPTYAAGGGRVLVLIDGELEVRDARRPDVPGVRIGPPTEGSQFAHFELSADGSTVLATAAGDRAASFVANAVTGTRRTLPDTSGWAVSSLDADGGHAVMVGETGLQLWDVERGELIAETSITDAGGASDDWFNGRPRFSSDGAFVDVATKTGVARFRADDLRPVSSGRAADFVFGDVDDVPGTDDVIGAGGAGRVTRWNMATGEIVETGRSRESSSFGHALVSPDGALVVARDFSTGRLALFDAVTLRPIGEPFAVGSSSVSLNPTILDPSFTPDGRYLAEPGPNGQYTLYDVDPDSWQDSVCLAAGRNLTNAEWAEYIGPDEPYRRTCPNWPDG